MNNIVNLNDIRNKKRLTIKKNIQHQQIPNSIENEMVNYLNEEFDLTLSQIRKTKKGDDKNGNT